MRIWEREIGVRTMNERENDWSLTWLNALIVTDWDDTDWEGVPDIIPVEGLRMSPWGRGGEIIQFVIPFISIGNEMSCWVKNE